MKTPEEFLLERAGRVLSDVPKLSPTQRRALMGDERDMETLDFRDRDELIVLGLARRIKPTDEHPHWRTWVTISGLMMRALMEEAARE